MWWHHLFLTQINCAIWNKTPHPQYVNVCRAKCKVFLFFMSNWAEMCLCSLVFCIYFHINLSCFPALLFFNINSLLCFLFLYSHTLGYFLTLFFGTSISFIFLHYCFYIIYLYFFYICFLICSFTFASNYLTVFIAFFFFFYSLSIYFLSFIVYPVFLPSLSLSLFRSCPGGATKEQGARRRGRVLQWGERGDASREDFGSWDGCGAKDGASCRWKLRWKLCEFTGWQKLMSWTVFI